jgi:O-antigen/teichoic acid export membrane protein
MGSYDVSRVKSSLLHFGIGKVASGITGLLLLLVLVRALPAADYACMVGLIAFFEISTLILNFGVMPATWRYLPETRSQGSAHNVMTVSIFSIVARSLPLLLAAGLIAAFPGPLARWLGFGIDNAELVVQIFAVVVFAESLSRHIDLVFELLLLQRLSQLMLWLRAMARVLGMLALTSGLTAMTSVLHWVVLEACVATAGLVAGLAVYGGTIVRQGKRAESAMALPGLRRVITYAGPAYVAQVLGAFQGLDACKLVVAQFAPASVVAAFGFVASIAGTLQRYLPSYLLLGFVRPLFVHASMAHGGSATTQALASMLLKFNLLVLVPAFGCALVAGGDLVAGLSGGRVTDSGMLLALTAVVLCVQVLHMILGLLALSVEESVSGMKGTALGAIIFGAAAVVGAQIGVYWLLLSVALCEVVWCITVLRAIRRKGSDLPWQWAEYLKLGLAGVLGTGAAFLVARLLNSATEQHISWVVLACAVAFLGAVVALRPLNEGERTVMRKLLPSRFVVI